MVKRLVEHPAEIMILNSPTGMWAGFLSNLGFDFFFFLDLSLPIYTPSVSSRGDAIIRFFFVVISGLGKCLCCGFCRPCEK